MGDAKAKGSNGRMTGLGNAPYDKKGEKKNVAKLQ